MRAPTTGRPVYSLVIPVFNEEAALPILLNRIDRLLSSGRPR